MSARALPGDGRSACGLRNLRESRRILSGGKPAEERVSEVNGPDPETGILVVEDEDMLRAAVSKLLRRRGFSVMEANDGTSAVDLLRAHGNRIAVVLLDVT